MSTILVLWSCGDPLLYTDRQADNLQLLTMDRKLDVKGDLPAVGNTVDVKKATYTNSIGEAELAVVWEDADFNASQRAVYYVRVLEIPTPRYSTMASAKLGQDPWAGAEPIIQERAYSSPIWYTP